MYSYAKFIEENLLASNHVRLDAGRSLVKVVTESKRELFNQVQIRLKHRVGFNPSGTRSNHMSRLIVSSIAACLIFPAVSSSEGTRFVNLSSQPIALAAKTYRSSSSGKVIHQGWIQEGWWVVAPGITLEMKPGAYYVESKSAPITWKGLSSSPGVVNNGNRFSQFVGNFTQTQDFDRLSKQGFRVAQFQDFSAQQYVFGSDYRIASRSFQFDCQSRDPHYHVRQFDVPGNVVNFTYDARKWNSTRAEWIKRPTGMTLTVSTRGEQLYLTGPREPGFYSGSVTVYYTVRK